MISVKKEMNKPTTERAKQPNGLERSDRLSHRANNNNNTLKTCTKLTKIIFEVNNSFYAQICVYKDSSTIIVSLSMFII